MKLGIAKYNAECRSIVMRYANEWEATVNRVGRWIDFKNDYKTMYPWFMESVWYASLLPPLIPMSETGRALPMLTDSRTLWTCI